MTLCANFLLGLALGASIIANGAVLSVPSGVSGDIPVIPDVPFYSQFYDIHSAKWQKLGCGIASLAMLIEFYKPGIVSVDALLNEGIAAGAFINGAGWSHKGLALLAKKYGLGGGGFDLSKLDADSALAKLKEFLQEGPVIASVRYKFEPKNPIPHLVVINGIDGDTIYYNDPAAIMAGKTISVQDFMNAWKKRLIMIRPQV